MNTFVDTDVLKAVALALLLGTILALKSLKARLSRGSSSIPTPHSAWLYERKLGQQPWKLYSKWSLSLGPLICVQPSGIPTFVLDSPEVIFELFEKRSKIYSCRPRWPMAELLGRQENVGFMYYGQRLKRARRLLHNNLKPEAIPLWEPLLHSMALGLTLDIIRDPSALSAHVRRHLQSLSVRLAYGADISEDFLEHAEQVSKETGSALQPGRWFVNSYPILAYIPAWLPGATFQRWARSARASFVELTKAPFERVKKEMRDGLARPSIVRHCLEEMQQNPKRGIDEGLIMSTASSIFSASVDTTAAAILTFFALMARHPEVQLRAYQEISKVVGKDRTPTLQDRASMPYVEAIIKEVLRYNPPVPLATHSPRINDEFMGYRIPKKSWMFANIWSVLHKDKHFSSPETFQPERFMDTQGVGGGMDPRDFVFGFGRRACPGMHFASSMLFLVVTDAILFGTYGVSEAGLFTPLEYMTGLVSMPLPFEFQAIARRETAALLTYALDNLSS